MSFRLNVSLDDYEFRALRTGNGQNGAWMSLVLESPEDSRQLDVSVPRDMHADVYDMALKKGDRVSANVVAYAGPEYSRVSLIEFTQVVDSDGEVLS